MIAQEILADLESQGARFWEENGALRYSAPKGLMDQKRRQQLAAVKEQLLPLLRRRGNGEGNLSITTIKPDPTRLHEPFPLNDMQAAYLVGGNELFETGNISCHAYIELYKDNIEIECLRVAWNALIARHPMLRAVTLPGGKQQILEKVPEYDIAVQDLRDIPEKEHQKLLTSIRSEMEQQTFATGTWPLFALRISLLPKGAGILHMGFDQIIADGYSLQLIFRDLHALYEGQGDILPNLNLSFRDCILSNQIQEQSAQYQRSKNYWEHRIPLLPDSPHLPLVVDPSTITLPHFTHRSFRLEKDTWDCLKARATEQGLPASSAVLAAYADVLASWSAEQQFTLNMTLFNRPPLHPQIMDVVGEFTSVSLLEIDRSKPYSFIEFAKSVQAQLWQDLDHRYYSGVKVIRALGKARQTGTSAQMPVVYTSTIGITPQGPLARYGLPNFGEVLYSATQTPQVWLDNQVFEQGGTLVCHWDALEELFPNGMLDAMFTAFEALLRRLATDTASWQSTARPPLPGPVQELRQHFNATDAPLDSSLLHHLFDRSAQRYPDRIAIIAGQARLSYAELRRRALALAQALRKRGAGPEQLVAVMLEKGLDQIVTVLGILYSGAAYLPVDPTLPMARRQELLQLGEVSLVVTNTYIGQEFVWPQGIEALTLDNLELPSNIFIPNEEQEPETLAYVLFTSGSTGNPKGVAIEHRSAVNTILDINRRFRITEQDVGLALASLSFDLSVYDIFGLLAAGGSVVIPDADKLKEPEHWLELIVQYGVTFWNSVPALLNMLCESGAGTNMTLHTLRVILLSGDWIPLALPETARSLAPQSQIISLGGATEASIWSLCYPIENVDQSWKSIPYGRPLTNQRMYVLDGTLSQRPDWTPGDLYIGGVGLARCYWRDPEKTAESFLIHPVTGERLYKTGDMARHLPGGVLEFLGRKDGQVKVGGFRIELGEIECVLQKMPGVYEAAVTADQDSVNGTRLLHAHIVPENDTGSMILLPTAAEQECGANWRSLLLSSRTAAHKLPVGVTDIQNFADFWINLDELCLANMCRTLRDLGVFTKRETLTVDEIIARGQVTSTHRKLLVRWLNALSREGFLTKQGHDRYACPAPLPENDLAALWNLVRSLSPAIGHPGELLTYMERSCADLIQLFRGDVNPQELLFPEGAWNVAEDVYQYNPMSQYFFSILAAAFAALVQERRTAGTFRVLEVGAGVGSSTAELLPLVDSSHTHYLYTDISPFFFDKAKTKFSDYNFIKYALFDINISPFNQGFEKNSFDVIIANNVLHNAADMRQTMNWLNSLLDQDGCILILEQTGPNYPLLVTMEFLIDFSELKDERLGQDSPFLSEERWMNTLAACGFSQCASLPPAGHPCAALGQHVLMAQSGRQAFRLNETAVTEFLRLRLPAYMIPKKFSLLERIPLTETGKVDRKALGSGSNNTAVKSSCKSTYVEPSDPLEKKLATLWAEILGMDKVSMNDDFFACGGDSLQLTRLMARMREIFSDCIGLEALTLRTLFEKPTLVGMAQALRSLVDNSNIPEETADHSIDSPLVLMNSAGEQKPFFIISDGRGRLFVYNHLRRHIDCNRPLYGLQVHDIKSYIDSGANIGNLAENYIHAIRSVQPVGPYHLGGFCMGGIIAYEMARQLKNAGENVEQTILISSMKPPFLIDDEVFIFYMLCKELLIPLERVGLEVSAEEFNNVAAQFQNLGCTASTSTNWQEQMRHGPGASFLAKYQKLSDMNRDARLDLAYKLGAETGNQYISRMSKEELADIFAIYRVSVASVARYEPQPYDGAVTVFVPAERDAVMSKSMDIVEIWTRSGAQNVTFISTPGSHVTCLEEPYVSQLATRLNELLRHSGRQS